MVRTRCEHTDWMQVHIYPKHYKQSLRHTWAQKPSLEVFNTILTHSVVYSSPVVECHCRLVIDRDTGCIVSDRTIKVHLEILQKATIIIRQG